MKVLADTSALVALILTDDMHHLRAAEALAELAEAEAQLVVHNFLLAETCAVLQRRGGSLALAHLQDHYFPLLDVILVDWAAYLEGVKAAITRERRDLSVTDCLSFATMRAHEIERAFTFDPHFVDEGFDVIPERP